MGAWQPGNPVIGRWDIRTNMHKQLVGLCKREARIFLKWEYYSGRISGMAGYQVWPDIRCDRISGVAGYATNHKARFSLVPGPRGRRRRRIFLIWTCGQLYLDSGSTHPSWSQLRHLLKPFFGILFTVHGKWSYELPVNPLNIFHFWWQSVNNFIIYWQSITHIIFNWPSIND